MGNKYIHIYMNIWNNHLYEWYIKQSLLRSKKKNSQRNQLKHFYKTYSQTNWHMCESRWASRCSRSTTLNLFHKNGAVKICKAIEAAQSERDYIIKAEMSVHEPSPLAFHLKPFRDWQIKNKKEWGRENDRRVNKNSSSGQNRPTPSSKNITLCPSTMT